MPNTWAESHRHVNYDHKFADSAAVCVCQWLSSVIIWLSGRLDQKSLHSGQKKKKKKHKRQ